MTTTAATRPAGRRRAAGLTLAALGVVFGDIGTSPLYTIREAFSPHYGLIPDHDTVLGILSLVFWSLMIVITVKYVSVVTRADNDGEGGILALTALIHPGQRAATAYGWVSARYSQPAGTRSCATTASGRRAASRA